MLEKITNSFWLNVLSSLVLIFTGGYQIWTNLGHDVIGAHHGITFLGIIQLLKEIPKIKSVFQHTKTVKDLKKNSN